MRFAEHTTIRFTEIHTKLDLRIVDVKNIKFTVYSIFNGN